MEGINSSPERKIGSNKEEVEGRSQKKARNRGHWTPVEDEKLKRLVEDYGEHNWNQIAHNLEGRSAQSCMQRWHNRPFDETEERRLLGALAFLGNKWSWIAVLFPGRTADAVKKQWLGFMERKRRDENTGDAKRKKGIDGRYTRCRAGKMNIGSSSNGTENGTSFNPMPQALASESHRNHEERELTVPFIDFLGIGSI